MKSKKIIFQDNYDKVITPAQAKLLGFYCKLIYSDNELKIKIYFFNNMANDAEYYLSKNEDANAILQKLNPEFPWTVYSDKEIINEYIIWKGHRVINNVLEEGYSKIVNNSNNKLIAYFIYSNKDELIKGSKYFSLAGKDILDDGNAIGVFEEGDEVIFQFNSSVITEIDTNTEIFFKPYKTLSYFLSAQQRGPILSLMTPEMLSYFINPLPLVPNFKD